ncbi:MAG: hypothetical protein IPI10_06910 [Bacteroidetes bacterium]|nr:hypothetical protein [Bacteroidota bacterium]
MVGSDFSKTFIFYGEYVPSRLPGYPVHEFLCTLASPFGYIGMNLISAIFTTIAVTTFALILRSLRFKSIFLAATTFSFVPVIFIHSTTTIDYNIALAFIMLAMFFMIRDKLFVAGCFVALAIGTRLTSGAMLLPLSIMLLRNDGFNGNIKRIAKMVIPAVIGGVLFYIPLMSKYGLGFFTYYDVPYPAIPKVLYKLSIEVWGTIGILGIFISTILFFLPHNFSKNKFLFPRSINEKYVIAWLVAVDIYIIAFLKLPMESGYLIPIVPFIIMIYGKYLYNRAFVFFCSMLIVSSLICTISPADRYDAASVSSLTSTFNAGGEKLTLDYLQGPVYSYHTRRKNGIEFVNSLLSSMDTITIPSVIVSGRWYNQLIVQSNDTSKLKAKIRDYISEPEALYFYAKGYLIYYLPKQEYYNKVMRNVDLDVYRAIPYLKEN